MSVISYEEAINILASMDYTVEDITTSDYTTFTVTNRIINIPLNTFMTIEGDSNSRIIRFEFNRYFDGLDLSTKDVRVRYINALNQSGYTVISDTTIEVSTLSFLWTVPSNVSVADGIVSIQVDYYDLVGTDVIYRWQTLSTSLEVIKTLEVGADATSPDYTYQLLFYNANNNDVTILADMNTLDEPIIINGRNLIIPTSLNLDIVQDDTRSRLIPFVISRYYDGMDLSTQKIFIKFLTPSGEGDRSRIYNMVVNTTTITFCWLILGNATKTKGYLHFSVEIIGYNANNEFYYLQTKEAQLNVIENLKVDSTTVQPTASWIESLYIDMDDKVLQAQESATVATQKSDEVKSLVVSTPYIGENKNWYIFQNGVYVDSGVPAQVVSDGGIGTGTSGVDGKTWYSGSTIPLSTLGVMGDFYLNIATSDVYKKTDASTWTYQMNLKGQQGNQGIQGVQGISAYQVAVNNGYNGTQIEWLASLKGTNGSNGTNGTNGNTWYSGTISPTADLGIVGDFYLNTISYDIYKKTTNSTWTFEINIKGQQGNQGIQGIQGLSAYQIAVNNGYEGTPSGTKRQIYSWGRTFPTTSAPPLLNQTSPTTVPDCCSPIVLESTSSPPRSYPSSWISGYFSAHFSAALAILEVLA
jgi:hypothetical protein